MDKLKEYLLRHKVDLDVDSPASGTWDRIGSKIPARPGFPSWVLRYTAAACIITLAGMGLWLVLKKDHAAPAVIAKRDSSRVIKSGPVETVPATDVVRNTAEPKPVRHHIRPPKPGKSSDEVDIIGKSYTSLINQQLTQLRATPLYAENSNYFSFYIEQLKQLDEDEQAVRKDIKTYGLTNGILEQLINVYQQKLDILKNLQTEVNKMNNKVMRKQTPTEKPDVHYLHI